MALYNEVQKYYDNGLEIPEDVTLLFSDDNFGTLRRLPNEDELKRPGGSGVRSYPCSSSSLTNTGSVLLPFSVHRVPALLQVDEQQHFGMVTDLRLVDSRY